MRSTYVENEKLQKPFSKLRTKIGPEEYRIMKQFSYAMVEAIMTNEPS
ncbi:MAG: hypothetical protein WAM42_25780 [Candidatus Nitrosopolaris sp.]|jgi:hypothetical protein